MVVFNAKGKDVDFLFNALTDKNNLVAFGGAALLIVGVVFLGSKLVSLASIPFRLGSRAMFKSIPVFAPLLLACGTISIGHSIYLVNAAPSREHDKLFDKLVLNGESRSDAAKALVQASMDSRSNAVDPLNFFNPGVFGGVGVACFLCAVASFIYWCNYNEPGKA